MPNSLIVLFSLQKAAFMHNYRSTIVFPVSRVTPVQRRITIKPMYDQQHYTINNGYQTNRKNHQHPSFLANSSELPLNNQFRKASRTERCIAESPPAPLSNYTISSRFREFKNSTTKNTNQKLQGSSKVCFIFAGISLTIITLAAMVMSTYLLINTPNGTTSTTTTCPLIRITQPNDTIVGIYNTTAGQSIGGLDGIYSRLTEEPPKAIDGLLNTKYLNFGNNGPGPAGINTGFYVIPNISIASVACGLLFGIAMDVPERDPITVTLEGTNSIALNSTNDWTLIYSGPTGIDPINIPKRSTYATAQCFSNKIPYRSYRLLVISLRNASTANSVQYSEAQILGCY